MKKLYRNLSLFFREVRKCTFGNCDLLSPLGKLAVQLHSRQCDRCPWLAPHVAAALPLVCSLQSKGSQWRSHSVAAAVEVGGTRLSAPFLQTGKLIT